jgi:hypothetical protein
MKRRARANSVEADLNELNALHESIRRSNVQAGVLVTEESHTRNEYCARENAARRRLERDAESDRKNINARVDKANQRAKPPPMVAAMGELFLKSRERDREIRALKEAERLGARQARIDREKRNQRRLIQAMSEERSAVDDQRHERIFVARQRQRAALECSREVMNDRRCRSVMSMIEERIDRKARKCTEDHERRAAVRVRMDADRSASPSPSLFLKLPPLNVNNGKQDVNSHLVRALREDDALRASPLPLDDDFVTD